MSMWLSNGEEYFNCSNRTWGHLIDVAQRYGWEPAGTHPPEFEVWHGGIHELGVVEVMALQVQKAVRWDKSNYYTNDHQEVTAEDAANLADALEAAMQRGEALEGDEPFLRDLVDLCRAGAFYIA
jgi:hypothetical protein